MRKNPLATVDSLDIGLYQVVKPGSKVLVLAGGGDGGGLAEAGPVATAAAARERKRCRAEEMATIAESVALKAVSDSDQSLGIELTDQVRVHECGRQSRVWGLMRDSEPHTQDVRSRVYTTHARSHPRTRAR